MKQTKVRLISLLACAALVGSAAYLRAGDTLAQDFAGPANQNDLTGPTKDITVEMHEGTNMAAVPSPDGTKMVLSLQGGLWIIPAGGGKATKITSWDVEATQPAWSPDGQWIAFQNYSMEANYAIWVVKADGSQLHALTSGPFDDREPSWYPGLEQGHLLVRSEQRQAVQDMVGHARRRAAAADDRDGRGEQSRRIARRQQDRVRQQRQHDLDDAGGPSAAPVVFGSGNYPQWTPNSANLVYQNGGDLILNGSAVTNDEDLFPFPVQFTGASRFMYTASGKIRTRDASGGSLQDIEFSATQVLHRPKFTPSASRPSLGGTGTQRVKGINGAVISPDGNSVAFIALNDLWVMKIGDDAGAPHQRHRPRRRSALDRRRPIVYWSTRQEQRRQPRRRQDRRRHQAAHARRGDPERVDDPADAVADRGSHRLFDRFRVCRGHGHRDDGRARRSSTSSSPQPQVSRPFWSHDGTKVMFVDNDRINPRFREGYNKLRVVDIATKTATWYPVGPMRRGGLGSRRRRGRVVARRQEGRVHQRLRAQGDADRTPTARPSGPAVQITDQSSDMPSWAGRLEDAAVHERPASCKKIRADGTGSKNVPLDLTYKPAAPQGHDDHPCRRAVGRRRRQTLQARRGHRHQGNRITAIRPHTPSAAHAGDEVRRCVEARR